MYQNQLLDAYKKAQSYVQDKQIAADMNVPPQRISDFRKGKRYMTDTQAIFLAEQSGLDPEIALLGCHADRNENPQIKAVWEGIAKKYNGLGLTGISMACTGLAVMITSPLDPLSQCVLYPLMVNRVSYQLHINPLEYKGLYEKLSKNEPELRFS
ncbi:bacteriophage f237 ORF10 [Vibrio sp. AND4]|nr:bacteriophage f237 ORF10 [Vibrio sp. AND4]